MKRAERTLKRCSAFVKVSTHDQKRPAGPRAKLQRARLQPVARGVASSRTRRSAEKGSWGTILGTGRRRTRKRKIGREIADQRGRRRKIKAGGRRNCGSCGSARWRRTRGATRGVQPQAVEKVGAPIASMRQCEGRIPRRRFDERMGRRSQKGAGARSALRGERRETKRKGRLVCGTGQGEKAGGRSAGCRAGVVESRRRRERASSCRATGAAQCRDCERGEWAVGTTGRTISTRRSARAMAMQWRRFGSESSSRRRRRSCEGGKGIHENAAAVAAQGQRRSGSSLCRLTGFMPWHTLEEALSLIREGKASLTASRGGACTALSVSWGWPIRNSHRYAAVWIREEYRSLQWILSGLDAVHRSQRGPLLRPLAKKKSLERPSSPSELLTHAVLAPNTSCIYPRIHVIQTSLLSPPKRVLSCSGVPPGLAPTPTRLARPHAHTSRPHALSSTDRQTVRTARQKETGLLPCR